MSSLRVIATTCGNNEVSRPCEAVKLPKQPSTSVPVVILVRRVALLLAITVEKYVVFARHCSYSWQQQSISSLRSSAATEATQYLCSHCHSGSPRRAAPRDDGGKICRLCASLQLPVATTKYPVFAKQRSC